MQILHTTKEIQQWRNSVTSVALIPTMGNLHEGHLALIHEAKKHAKHIAVSIFVNRIQFGQGEDFAVYPRTLAADAEKLKAVGVDVIFAPSEQELYPRVQQEFSIEPPHLQNELCGQFRPGHFRGVATVVAKLFNIFQADVACFGKKDYQQLTIIQGMVDDLNFNIKIIAVDTGRADDGLALSSRNQYLSTSERQQAPQLYLALQQIASELTAGNQDFTHLEKQAVQNLKQQGWNVDYIEIRHAQNLAIPRLGDRHLVVLAAARLGTTRLIDNIEVDLT